MLLRLTCPSCGRVEQASERVLGKEIRCPCGTQFRVLQPEGARGRRSPSSRTAAAAGGPPNRTRPRVRASRDRGRRPRAGSRETSQPPIAAQHSPGAVERTPEPPARGSPAQQQSAGMPPWAYAAVGGGRGDVPVSA